MPDFIPAHTHNLRPVEVDNLAITDNQRLALAIASQGTLTLDTQPTDTNTMTVGTKVYTFEDSLTNVDGNIYNGADKAGAQANIVAAFDLSGTPGVDYATAMTAHPTVDIAAFATDAAVLTAKTPGVAGDTIATTETFTAGTNVFDAVTLGTTRAGDDYGAGSLMAAVITAEDVAIRVNFGADASTTKGRFVGVGQSIYLNQKEILDARIASTGAVAAVSIVYYR